MLLALIVPCASGAQSMRERLNLDNLRLSGLGIAYGPVRPRTVKATHSYGMQADYGEIVPHWHVVFSASYWGSQFTDRTVDGFVQQLRATVIDPSGDDSIAPQRVTVSDISLEIDARWSPVGRSSFVQPYLGGGIGAHIVNAEGRLIANTFVESALDNIGTGITGLAGLDLFPSRRFSFGVEARYTFLSNVRFGTVRATAMYHFPFATQSAPPSS